MAQGVLQCLTVYLVQPSVFSVFLKFGQFLCLHIVVVGLVCLVILFLALGKEMVVHKAGATEMLCEQGFLLIIRFKSELVRLVYCFRHKRSFYYIYKYLKKMKIEKKTEVY